MADHVATSRRHFLNLALQDATRGNPDHVTGSMLEKLREISKELPGDYIRMSELPRVVALLRESA